MIEYHRALAQSTLFEALGRHLASKPAFAKFINEDYDPSTPSSLSSSSIPASRTPSKKDVRKLSGVLFNVWDSGLKEGLKIDGDIDYDAWKQLLEHIWLESSDALIKRLFEDEPSHADDAEHIRNCRLVLEDGERGGDNTPLSSSTSEVSFQDRGIAGVPPKWDSETQQWKVTCYCGRDMRLERIKTDRLVETFCHCGRSLQPKIYKCGSRLWICTDEECSLTMEVDSRSGDGTTGSTRPLGTPASAWCKSLRLFIHLTMKEFCQQRNWNKGQFYSWLSNRLDIPGEKTHMALMDIPRCCRVIWLMQNEPIDPK